MEDLDIAINTNNLNAISYILNNSELNLDLTRRIVKNIHDINIIKLLFSKHLTPDQETNHKILLAIISRGDVEILAIFLEYAPLESLYYRQDSIISAMQRSYGANFNPPAYDTGTDMAKLYIKHVKLINMEASIFCIDTEFLPTNFVLKHTDLSSGPQKIAYFDRFILDILLNPTLQVEVIRERLNSETDYRVKYLLEENLLEYPSQEKRIINLLLDKEIAKINKLITEMITVEQQFNDFDMGQQLSNIIVEEHRKTIKILTSKKV